MYWCEYRMFGYVFVFKLDLQCCQVSFPCKMHSLADWIATFASLWAFFCFLGALLLIDNSFKGLFVHRLCIYIDLRLYYISIRGGVRVCVCVCKHFVWCKFVGFFLYFIFTYSVWEELMYVWCFVSGYFLCTAALLFIVYGTMFHCIERV